MKLKYLGTFVHGIDFAASPDEIDEIEDISFVWTNLDNKEDVIDDEFMRIDDELFNGSMSDTNTSALVIILDKIDDTAKIWRSY